MRILFLFVALIFITSCEKENLVTMIYQETQCSDIWITNGDNTISTEKALTDYFNKTHDIKIKDVTIKVVSNGPFCEACHCSSGREIQVSIDEKFISTMESERFEGK